MKALEFFRPKGIRLKRKVPNVLNGVVNAVLSQSAGFTLTCKYPERRSLVEECSLDEIAAHRSWALGKNLLWL